MMRHHLLISQTVHDTEWNNFTSQRMDPRNIATKPPCVISSKKTVHFLFIIILLCLIICIWKWAGMVARTVKGSRVVTFWLSYHQKKREENAYTHSSGVSWIWEISILLPNKNILHGGDGGDALKTEWVWMRACAHTHIHTCIHVDTGHACKNTDTVALVFTHKLFLWNVRNCHVKMLSLGQAGAHTHTHTKILPWLIKWSTFWSPNLIYK